MLSRNYPLKPFEESSLAIDVSLDLLSSRSPAAAQGLNTSVLTLNYFFSGVTEEVRWPDLKANPARKDNLWQSTCLEFFIGAKQCKRYVELNFCPSGDWAAYVFADYRQGRIDPDFGAPVIRQHHNGVGLSVCVPWSALQGLLGAGNQVKDYIFAITACVQEGDAQSFWSHAHTADQPDFHDHSLYLSLEA